MTTHVYGNNTEGAPQLEGPLKPQSLFSFSTDSLTSAEDFSSLEWGASSAENDDAFKAMMAGFSPHGAGVFALGDEYASNA